MGGAWDQEHTGGWGLGPDRVGPGTKTTLMGLGLGRTDTTLEGWAWDRDYTTPIQSIVTPTQDQNYVYIIVCDQISSSFFLSAPQLKVAENRLTVTGEKGYCMIRATHGEGDREQQYRHNAILT